MGLAADDSAIQKTEWKPQVLGCDGSLQCLVTHGWWPEALEYYYSLQRLQFVVPNATQLEFASPTTWL